MRWLEIAWEQQGIAETPGAEATPEILAYFRDAGRADVTSDETAWCAAFVAACLARGGIALDAIPQSRRLLASAYETFGTEVPLDAPRTGCICVFDVGGATGSGRHVGFVTGWTDTTIAVLGGNQADAVNVKHFRRDKLVALRWPEPPVTAADLAAAGSRTVTQAFAQMKDAAKGVVALASGVAAKVSAPEAPLKPPRVSGHVRDLLSDATLIKSFGVFCLQSWPWIAMALAMWWLGSMAVKAGWIAEARVSDQNSGANTGRRTGANNAAGA